MEDGKENFAALDFCVSLSYLLRAERTAFCRDKKERKGNAMPKHSKQYYKEKFFKTKQDLAVQKFENKIQPELQRRISTLEEILLFISPTNKEYRIIQNILDNAKALKMPSDNQMNYASFIFYKHNILGKVD